MTLSHKNTLQQSIFITFNNKNDCLILKGHYFDHNITLGTLIIAETNPKMDVY